MVDSEQDISNNQTTFRVESLRDATGRCSEVTDSSYHKTGRLGWVQEPGRDSRWPEEAGGSLAE